MAARLSSSTLLQPKPRPGQLGLLTSVSSQLGRPLCGQRLFSSSSRLDKQRLVILGSGWGGYEVLRKVNRSLYGKLGLGDGTLDPRWGEPRVIDSGRKLTSGA